MTRRILVAFDFDHTLIADNSDTYIRRLAPTPGQIPADITKLYSESGWTRYMDAIFEYLHASGTTQLQLLACVGEIPLVDGMRELLNHMMSTKSRSLRDGLLNADCCGATGNGGMLSNSNPGCKTENCSNSSVEYESIIISDANSVFIDHILSTASIDRERTFSAIYTNPASFDGPAGRLRLSPYHHQDWCKLSTSNLCKGHILDEHRTKSALPGGYDVIAYVGDGSNDLCPSLRLRAGDLVFPRRGYGLAKRITEAPEKLVANVVPWDSGLEILEALKKLE